MAKYINRIKVSYPTDTVFAAACYADRINNGEYIKIITQAENSQLMVTNRELMTSALDNQELITDADREEGKKVRSYFQAFTFKILQGKQLNEFNNTAMFIANRDTITSNYDVAVICSLPATYAKSAKRDDVDRRINFARGGYVGTTGDKVKLTIEVVKRIWSEKWMTSFVTGITTEDQVVFFAYKHELVIGNTITIQGNVKGQRDNSTQLNRVKVI